MANPIGRPQLWQAENGNPAVAVGHDQRQVVDEVDAVHRTDTVRGQFQEIVDPDRSVTRDTDSQEKQALASETGDAQQAIVRRETDVLGTSDRCECGPDRGAGVDCKPMRLQGGFRNHDPIYERTADPRQPASKEPAGIQAAAMASAWPRAFSRRASRWIDFSSPARSPVASEPPSSSSISQDTS
jgi:hypothetical protein